MAKKQNLSYQDIEASLQRLKEQHTPASEVGFAVLRAFGKNEADIRRYRESKVKAALMTKDGQVRMNQDQMAGLFAPLSPTSIYTLPIY